MMSRSIDVDEFADKLGAIATKIGRCLSPEIARRIEAIQVEIVAAVLAPKPARRPPPAFRDVEQWV